MRCAIESGKAADVAGLLVPNGWGELGWSELLEHAQRLTAVTAEMIDDFKALTLVDTRHLYTTWLAPTMPAYKATDRHWVRWTGGLYR